MMQSYEASSSGGLGETAEKRSAFQDAFAPENGYRHIVQFYEDEAFLGDVVADFLAEGLLAGHPVLIIATKPHHEAFSSRLLARGIAVEDALHNGQIRRLDARELLDAIMAGSIPDRPRFAAALGRTFNTSAAEHSRPPARIYGEMVDLLWKDGKKDGAIRLEQLWNELACSHPCSLLCAYAMNDFDEEKHRDGFQEICQQHTHVIPTEQYTQAGNDARLLEVSRLQQRAAALESEIQHRKMLERRLREALVARQRTALELERTAEREQTARADADAAKCAKSDFLAVMSHELRTPLNAIAGYVQLIELGVYGPVTDQQAGALARVQRSERHLLALINDVLNFVRIEAGHVDYEIEQLPVAPLLTDAVALLEPMLSAGELTHSTTFAPSAEAAPAISVRADREKTRQILLNLLTNAIRFTPAGGRIALIVSVPPATPASVAIQVHDTGPGIPAAKLATIFEPFVQIGRQPDAPDLGAGLALGISRDLARGMSGDLTATSTVGRGATFTLTLPRA